MAFGSLAVDLGRVYVVRSELQLAADAAARFAAAGLKTGVTAAHLNAVDAADDNKADGSPVLLRQEDVELGLWDSTTRRFTPLIGTARSGANAVRVTARRTSGRGDAVPLTWGGVIGMRTCDVTVTAVARAARTSAGGFMGLVKFDAGNNASFSGYDSASGAPGPSNLLDIVNIGTNGTVSLGNNTDVHGSVQLGPTGNLSIGNNSDVTGSQTQLPAPMEYPPTEAPTVASAGTLNVGSNQTVTLSDGTHNYSKIIIDNGGTLTFSGSATVYVTEGLSLSNNASLVAYNNVPGNLRLRLHGAISFDTGNNPLIIADVYGPAAKFQAGNNLDFRGAMAVAEISVGTDANFYYDSRIDPAGAGGSAGILTVD